MIPPGTEASRAASLNNGASLYLGNELSVTTY